jgi:transcriptional regulator with XRE-family HTH domain
MKNFAELRAAAGLQDRAKFLEATGLSDRTLTAYDNDKAEPSIILLTLLRMMANGCRFCQNAHKRAKPHDCELRGA